MNRYNDYPSNTPVWLLLLMSILIRSVFVVFAMYFTQLAYNGLVPIIFPGLVASGDMAAEIDTMTAFYLMCVMSIPILLHPYPRRER
jgi:hypothetical protein